MAKKKITRKKNVKTQMTRSEHLLSKDVPVTIGLLYEVKDELIYKISSVDKKVDSLDKKIEAVDKKVGSLDKKIEAVDKRVDSLDKKIDAVDKKIDSLEKKMDSKFDGVYSEIHSLRALMEEQNAANKAVLDGYNQLYQRQERIEFTQKDQQEFLFSLKRYVERSI